MKIILEYNEKARQLCEVDHFDRKSSLQAALVVVDATKSCFLNAVRWWEPPVNNHDDNNTDTTTNISES